MLKVKCFDGVRISRDDEWRRAFRKLQCKELLITVSNRAGIVSHVHSAPLSKFQQIRRVDIVHIEWRVDPHEEDVKLLSEARLVA